MTATDPGRDGPPLPDPTGRPAESGPDPGEIGAAARSCLVILGLLLVLALIACVALVVRPLID